MRLSAWKRPLLSLAAIALVLGVGPPRAQAQDNSDPTFSSFWQDATFSSGFVFTINGVAVTSPVVGTNGDYQFGFSSASTPIVLSFSGTDPFGGTGSDQITGIDGVYLVANGPQDGKDSVTATLSSSGAVITAFNGSNSAPNWTGGTAPGANYPSYTAGNFGSSNYLREGSGTDPAFGDFNFNNIALSSSATTGVFFGLHLRASNGNTAFILFAPPGAPIPEPAYFQLGGLLALSGVGAAFRRLKKRRNA
ncbi:MAG TPA: hypothetical protein VKT32_11890 [Chthonomonadaceae bacterium]|nr:hypothetical protein [Chthonomonadaceae bacterium]